MKDDLQDEFLSQEDLDLKNLTEEELIVYWNDWLAAAQATNHQDRDYYSHSAFGERVATEDTSEA